MPPEVYPSGIETVNLSQFDASGVAAVRSGRTCHLRSVHRHHVRALQRTGSTTAVVRRPVGSVSIRGLPKPILRECLTRCAKWMKFLKGPSGKAHKVPAHPPRWSIDAVHARTHWPSIPRLEAVVTHPVLLGDGKILNANGFDPMSGLLVRLLPGLAVNVPEHPSREDVAAAVAVLSDVVQDFPFETPAHKAGWFASLFTPLAWFAFTGPSPMFLVDGNVRGVGKGLLADIVALILTGSSLSCPTRTTRKNSARRSRP
jgi:hypothetical protein